MADIRIKDLSSASSTASDDFIAVDGTTNGTRKLNAFSPTFGGNVVVTGTLTSQSTLSTSAGLICQNADITGGYITLRGYSDQNGGLIFLGQSSNNNFIQSNATTIGVTIAGTGVTQTVAAGFRVLATTASTTTSTGALVVSGGVGVAGALNGGGLFDFAVSANSTQVYTIQNTSTGASAATRFTLVGGSSSGSIQLYGSGHSTPNILQYASPDTHKWQCNGVERASLSSAGVLSLLATTASTSTSSGALVVSGGVGVAGAGYFGGIISAATAGSVFTTRLFINASTRNQTLTDGTAITGSNTADDLALRNDSGKIYLAAGGAVPQFTLTTTLATFDTAIKTAAPSGGTAANWKLGTVATVSPTSPNRTIEVDIGGTIYYIHAKTTNN